MNKGQSSPSSNMTKQMSIDSKIVPQQSNFIQKAYELINNQKNNQIIHWSKSGYTFIIEDIERFQRELLPLYFRHNRYQSFVRQLNMYDFHKIRNGDYYCDNKSEFRHEQFYRGNLESILHIKRKGFQAKNKQKENNTKNKKIHKNVVKKIVKKKKQIVAKPVEEVKEVVPSFEQQENSFFYELSMEVENNRQQGRQARQAKLQKIIQTILQHYDIKQNYKKSNKFNQIIDLAEQVKDRWLQNMEKISGIDDIKAMKEIYYTIKEQLREREDCVRNLGSQSILNVIEKNIIHQTKKEIQRQIQIDPFQMSEEEDALIQSIFRAEIRSTLICITSETILNGHMVKKIDTLMGF